jgi:hypothetical protein
MTTPFDPDVMQILAQGSPEFYKQVTQIQGNPQATDADRQMVKEVERRIRSIYQQELVQAALTTFVNQSNISKFVKTELLLISNAAQALIKLDALFRDSMTAQLKSVFGPNVDSTALKAIHDLCIAAFQHYKEGRMTIDSLPVGDDLTSVQENNDRKLRMLELLIREVPNLILGNPCVIVPPDQAEKTFQQFVDGSSADIVAELHATLSSLTKEREALSYDHIAMACGNDPQVWSQFESCFQIAKEQTALAIAK